MYIHHTLSFMNKKEQYIVNNKHVEQVRSQTDYDNYRYSDLIYTEKMRFNIDLNVFTVIADFICSGISILIGVLSDCKVGLN